MNGVRFDRPVYVAEGPSLIREINTPDEALDFLDEWPEADRDILYSTVRRMCQRSLELTVPLSAARAAFASWADENGILEDIAMPPWIAASGGAGRGGMPI